MGKEGPEIAIRRGLCTTVDLLRQSEGGDLSAAGLINPNDENGDLIERSQVRRGSQRLIHEPYPAGGFRFVL